MQQKISELEGIRISIPKKGEKWCVPCRVSTHSTSECIKCDYCGKRGHRWEECLVRLTVPSYTIGQAKLEKGKTLGMMASQGCPEKSIAGMVKKKDTWPGIALKSLVQNPHSPC